MAKNKISDLRDHLFETIEQLKDPEKPMELDRARAISEVAQVIINSAKVEVDALKVIGSGDVRTAGVGGSFFETAHDQKPRLVAGGEK